MADVSRTTVVPAPSPDEVFTKIAAGLQPDAPLPISAQKERKIRQALDVIFRREPAPSGDSSGVVCYNVDGRQREMPGKNHLTYDDLEKLADCIKCVKEHNPQYLEGFAGRLLECCLKAGSMGMNPLTHIERLHHCIRKDATGEFLNHPGLVDKMFSTITATVQCAGRGPQEIVEADLTWLPEEAIAAVVRGVEAELGFPKK
jgi:hypothetical protein